MTTVAPVRAVVSLESESDGQDLNIGRYSVYLLLTENSRVVVRFIIWILRSTGVDPSEQTNMTVCALVPRREGSFCAVKNVCSK